MQQRLQELGIDFYYLTLRTCTLFVVYVNVMAFWKWDFSPTCWL